MRTKFPELKHSLVTAPILSSLEIYESKDYDVSWCSLEKYFEATEATWAELPNAWSWSLSGSSCHEAMALLSEIRITFN